MGTYRRLLRLFPRRVRLERQGELEQLYRDMRSGWEEEHDGVGLRFWVGIVTDTVAGAVIEWAVVAGEVVRPRGTREGGEHMWSILGDARFALRQLVSQPAYASMIVLLMALGIAGNAAVFRVFNGLFLRPLPFDESGQLVDINETAPSWDLEYLSVAYRDFDAWRDGSSTFESMSAYDFGGGNLVMADGAVRITYLLATHDIDEVLRIEPLMGRFFGAEEDHPDGPRGGLLSEGFWEQHFARDPGVLGRTVSVNGFPIEILGILPPEARFMGEADMWMPLRADAADFDGWGLSAIGRLNPDVTVEMARADLTAIHKGLIPQWEVNEISSPTVDSLRDRYLGDYRLGSGVLLAAVGIVLLIACANIAGLMTVRAMARAPEIAVRRALGAPRSRIVRQLLTESLMVAAVGSALGAALGIWGSELLIGPLSEQYPSWVVFDLDLRFLTFTLFVTVAAAVLFGLTPALGASGRSLGLATNRSTASAGRRRRSGMLVAGEVAMALALLVVGGLSVLDVHRLGRVDPGFDPDGLISYQLGLPTQRYEDEQARLAFADEYLERLRAVPGVESAALTSGLPLSGHWGWFFLVDGAPARETDEANPVVLHRVVSSDYFETTGVQLIAGRGFEPWDGREGQSPVIVVNETFVRTHLSHLDDPIGARLTPGTDLPEDGDVEWMTVVGVTRDVKHYGVDEEMRPGVYRPLPAFPLGGFQAALRTRGELQPIMSEVRAVTAEMDVELPVYSVATMTDTMNEALFTRRAIAWLIGVFSAVALLMAVAGIYGVIAYSVSQRGREISIRMAMGADTRSVLRGVVAQGMRLVALGAAVGLALSFAAARTVSGILVDVSATNPTVYAGVTLLVVTVAAAANYLPARRAAGLDPATALRGD